MEYRLVETAGESRDALEDVVELQRFDSAYHAVDVMRRALDRSDQRVWRWYVLDDCDRVLFGPDDLVEIDAAA